MVLYDFCIPIGMTSFGVITKARRLHAVVFAGCERRSAFNKQDKNNDRRANLFK